MTYEATAVIMSILLASAFMMYLGLGSERGLGSRLFAGLLMECAVGCSLILVKITGLGY